jgi:hypothetical protein
MKNNLLKCIIALSFFNFTAYFTKAQVTLGSNTLTGTAPIPTQYVGSGNAFDVIFKSNNFERLRFTAGTSTVSNMQLHSSTTFLGAANGFRLSGAAGNTAASPIYGFNVIGETGVGMFRSAANQLSFATNGTERIRVLSSGFVGIGNLSPSATLDVTGTAKFSTNLTSPIHLFNANNGFSWTQGANANVGTFLYGKVVTPTLPTTNELTSSVKHKFAGGIKLFETDLNGNFPTIGSQLNIQPTIDGYLIDVIGANKFLDINQSGATNKTRLWNNTILAVQEDYNAKALSVKVYDTGDETETFTIYGGGRTRIGGTPINAPVNFTNASLISSVGGINSGNIYNTILNTSNDLQKGLAIFKFNNTANSYTENFSVQGNGQTNIGQVGANFGGTGSNNHMLGVNGAMRIGGGLNYLTMHHDGGSNTINGYGPSTPAGLNDLNIGEYSPMNVAIAANQAGYGNLSVFGNINANSNLNIGSPAAAPSRLNILAPEGSMGIVSKTNHTGINGYNVQLFTSKNMTKALAIQNEEITNAALRETFLVYGNGSTTINAEVNTSNTEIFKINSANSSSIYERQFTIYADGGTAIGGVINGVGGLNKLPAGYKLSVNGKIITEEVLVSLRGNWPDYVFNNNYKLKNIDELETYIKTNKHLPNIPSASEMATGIETGNMITKQMEKIEELTLYIIEQNKNIKAQNKTIEEQEKRLKALEGKLK